MGRLQYAGFGALDGGRDLIPARPQVFQDEGAFPVQEVQRLCGSACTNVKEVAVFHLLFGRIDGAPRVFMHIEVEANVKGESLARMDRV